MWGCENKTRMSEPTFEERVKGKTYRYFNCPIKFVPDNVWQFFKIYDAIKLFNLQMPTYNNISSRFIFAAQYYESKLSEFIAESEK